MAQQGTAKLLNAVIKEFNELPQKKQLDLLKVALENQARKPVEEEYHYIALAMGYELKGNKVYFKEEK